MRPRSARGSAQASPTAGAPAPSGPRRSRGHGSTARPSPPPPWKQGRRSPRTLEIQIGEKSKVISTTSRTGLPRDLRARLRPKLDNSWWVPYISTPPSEHPEFQIPGQIPGQWVFWMFSVQSQHHAANATPPKGELTKPHPVDYTESRFRAFLKPDIKNALKNQTHENITIDPLIIPDTFTPTNIPLAYSLTRDAIMKLRSEKA